MFYKSYVIRDMHGRYWTGSKWGKHWGPAKKFSSVGAAVACMRQLKRIGYYCYYEED